MAYEWDRASVPQFTVSLDEPAATRWLPVLRNAALRRRLVHLLSGSTIEDLFSDASAPPPPGFATRHEFFNALKVNLWVQLRRLGAADIVREIEGMAVELGVPLCELVVLHLMYEAEGGGCTSVILPRGCEEEEEDGSSSTTPQTSASPVFGRVLDWDFAELLRPLTIQVRLVKKGKLVLEMLTFAGFVGCLTGRRPGICAAAINFRRPQDGAPLPSTSPASSAPPSPPPPSPAYPAWPAALLVRFVLQAPGLETFDEVVQIFSATRLWAPCYFCLSGSGPLDGVVIERETGAVGAAGAVVHRLDGCRGALVQTNVDRASIAEAADVAIEEDFMASTQRHRHVRKALRSVLRCRRPKEVLWGALGASPVVDAASVHACVFGADAAMSSAVLKVLQTEATRRKGEEGEEEGNDCLRGWWRSALLLSAAVAVSAVALRQDALLTIFNNLHEK